MIKKGILYLFSVFLLMSHSLPVSAYEGFESIVSWEVTSSAGNFLGFNSMNDNTWYSANIPSNSSRNIYVVCANLSVPKTFSSRQYFSAAFNFVATQPYIANNNYGIFDGGTLASRSWGDGLKTIVYQDVSSSSFITAKSRLALDGTLTENGDNQLEVDIRESLLNNHDLPTVRVAHSLNGYVVPGSYDKICFSGNALVWDTRLAPSGSSISAFLFYGGRINWFEDNQEATNDSIRNYNQQQEEAKDNISEQTTDDIEDTENANTSSLIDLFGSFVGVLTSASASNCSINGSLTNNFNMGVLNFCADDPPPFVSVIGSIFVIVVFIPLAYFMVKRIIAEIRSFTNG